MTNEADRPNTRQQMADTLHRLDVAAREFVVLWAEALPPDERERIEMILGAGLALGLHVNTIGAPAYEVTLTDAAGERRVLTRVAHRADPMKAN